MQEEQKGACSTISASQPLLLIFDQSESVNLLLHRSHLSWERSCSRSRDTLDPWDPGSWGSGLISAWASLSFWSLASRRSRARWSGRWHLFTSIGSVVIIDKGSQWSDSGPIKIIPTDFSLQGSKWALRFLRNISWQVKERYGELYYNFEPVSPLWLVLLSSSKYVFQSTIF